MESREEYKEIIHLLQENNKILKAQERRAKLHIIIRIIWILIIFGIPILTYIYFKDTIQDNMTLISNLQDIQQGNIDIPAILENYGIQTPSNY
jgi:hypothetical protein